MKHHNHRDDFPLLRGNKNVVYLDSSATSLKPQEVIDTVNEYYTEYSANIKRGLYRMSERATAEYENARTAVASLIGADSREIIFTKNTTESLNLVAYSLGTEIVGDGDEVVTTMMEHHSNFVPWQRLAAVNNAVFKVVDVTADGLLAMDKKSVQSVIGPLTKIVSLTHVSNVLGTINPVREIVAFVRKINPHAIIVVDGAQAAGHLPVNVRELGCDFYAFSGHKMLGPTGIGVLWGRSELLERMEPFLMGGEMIRSVSVGKTEFADIPEKFEAGTPPIAQAIGLGAAANYITSVGVEHIRQHEEAIVRYALDTIQSVLGRKITLYGPGDAALKGGIIAFNLKGVHPHDVASLLDERNICIRAGHHCAMPLHDHLSTPASCRISFHLYTSTEDIDRVIAELNTIHSRFAA